MQSVESRMIGTIDVTEDSDNTYPLERYVTESIRAEMVWHFEFRTPLILWNDTKQKIPEIIK